MAESTLQASWHGSLRKESAYESFGPHQQQRYCLHELKSSYENLMLCSKVSKSDSLHNFAAQRLHHGKRDLGGKSVDETYTACSGCTAIARD